MIQNETSKKLLWCVFILLILFLTLSVTLFLVGRNHIGSSYLNQCFVKYGESCPIFQEELRQKKTIKEVKVY
jgi:hypothetical protein